MQKTSVSPRVRYFKTVSDSEFHTVDSGSQAMDSGFLVLQWNLDSRFHSIAVLQIPRQNSAFQIPGLWISECREVRL